MSRLDFQDRELPWPSAGTAWYAVVVLLIANMFSFVDRMILNLLIAPVRRDLGISDTEISLLIGFAFALLFALMGLPLGRLADRIQRRLLIASGVAFWSVMTAACGIASSFWSLFLARVGVGAGEATLTPSAYSLISDYFPPDRLGRALAVYSFGAPVGSGLALMIGGAVVNLVSDMPPLELPLIGEVRAWQLAFLCVGLPGLLVAAWLCTLREPIRRGRARDDTSVPIRDVVRFVAQNGRAYGSHFFAVSMLSIVMYGAVAWTPQFFVRTYGLPIGDVGLVYGLLFLVFGPLGLAFGGALADRYYASGRADAHFRTILICIIVTLPFMASVPLMPSATAAFFAVAPTIFFSSMFGGSAPAALQLITPNELRGQVSALYFLVITLVGLGLGPTLYAVITDYVFGSDAALRYSLVVVTVTVLPAAAAMLLYGRPAYVEAVGRARAEFQVARQFR